MFKKNNYRISRISIVVLPLVLIFAVLGGSQLAERVLEKEAREEHIRDTIGMLKSGIDEIIFKRLEGAMNALAVTSSVKDIVSGRTGIDNGEILAALNSVKAIFKADIVYVINKKGFVIACTPHNSNRTLTGKNFIFRPYFKYAMEGRNGVYAAVGTTTDKRGIYFSAPVYAYRSGKPRGVVVVKIGFEKIDLFLKHFEDRVLLLSPGGIVFASNSENMMLKYAYPLSDETRSRIEKDRTLSARPLKPLPVFLDREAVVLDDNKYNVIRSRIEGVRWEFVILEKSDRVYAPGTFQKKLLYGLTLFIVFLIIIIFLLIKNIFERKIVERSLQKSRESYKTLFDLAPDGICITAMNGDILESNEAFVEIFKYSSSHLKEINIRELYANRERDRDILFLALKKSSVLKNFNIGFKDADGNILSTHNSFALVDYRGRKSIEVIIRDMTEFEKKEQQLRQIQKMETIGTLAGGLAHDFNNVLSAITGTVSILQFKLAKPAAVPPEELKKYMDTIAQSGDRASALVQQLLTLSRKKEMAFVPVDLNSTVKHIQKICDNTFDKCIVLDMKYSESPAIVNADPAQLEQVLLNLCINANHAMTMMRSPGEKQGGTLSVSLEKIFADQYFCASHPEAQKKEYWTMSVKDNGVGMDPKLQTKIFEPFFTTKEKKEGTGLGLAMAYNIIRQHQGFVDIYSEVGVGSVFNVFLPVFYGPENGVKIESDISLVRGEGIILVIDDEVIMRNLAKEMLIECGYEVLVASNGRRGLDIFREKHKRICLVLLDMIMPEMSGEETFLEIKNIAPDMKVLLATGLGKNEKVDHLISLGIDGYIGKPYTLSKLSKRVSEIISENKR